MYAACLFPECTDAFLNLGIAGSVSTQKPLGSVWEIHSIADYASGWNYFPDCVVQTPWESASLVTVDKPQYSELPGYDLVDMEGSAFFKAASFFAPTHKIFLLKIVSDYLEPQRCNPVLVQSWMENMMDTFLPWFQGLSQDQEDSSPPILELLEEWEENLLLTQSQKEELKKALTKYYYLNHQLPRIPREYLYSPHEKKEKRIGKEKLAKILEFLKPKF